MWREGFSPDHLLLLPPPFSKYLVSETTISRQKGSITTNQHIGDVDVAWQIPTLSPLRPFSSNSSTPLHRNSPTSRDIMGFYNRPAARGLWRGVEEKVSR